MALYGLITIMILFWGTCSGRVLGDQSEENLNYTFPEGFMFGAATSAYQIEGAWNVSGKGPSVWDTVVHNSPGLIKDNCSGDDAAKSYYLYNEDAKLVKDMGMNHYRFSIAWTRIIPTGLPNYINQEGIDHYNKVIDNLLDNGITPIVTLFHWDTPQYLQDLGGWTNPFIIEAFVEYARVVFENFGDRVKWWITLNEPQMLSLTYEGLPIFPYHPSKVTQGVGSYMSSRNLILAHGHVYHLYQKEFRESQNGKISLAMLVEWLEPLDPNSAEDKNAADGANNAQLGCFAEAIFGSGDFPERMKEKIEDLSKKEGFPRPRLPEFSPEEKQLVKGTSDYFALNYYGACLVTPALQPSESSVIAYLGVNAFPPWWLPVSNSSRWLTVAPQGIRKLMRFIKEKYGDLQIFVTENGYSDNGEIEDEMRKIYIGTHLAEIYKSMYIDGVNVIGYTVWSAIDSLEWHAGYESRFGLYYVNVTDPARPRIPKASSYMMKGITSSRKIPQKYIDLAANLSLDIRPEKSQEPVLGSF